MQGVCRWYTYCYLYSDFTAESTNEPAKPN
jgi:hypothetical protein